MRRIKQLAAVVLLASMAMSLVSCGTKNGVKKEDKTLKKITFALDWTPNTNHTGLYIAKEKGYFKEAGLDVQIVQSPEGGAEQLVASGNAQFGISFQDTLAACYASKNPLPITAVAAVLQHNTSGIVSRKGEGISTPKGLEGKKYATWNGLIEKAMIENVMKSAGGDFSKVTLIPNEVTDEVSALKTNSVDAIWIYYGWAGIACEKANLPIDYFAFRDLNPVFDYYTPVIIGNNEYMKNNTETTKAFLQAAKKGYQDAVADPQAAAKVLTKEVPELDYDLVLGSQNYLKDVYVADASAWGVIDPARWNGFYQWLNENNLVESKLLENTGFTNDYLAK